MTEPDGQAVGRRRRRTPSAQAALGRPESETEPLDGEVVREREQYSARRVAGSIAMATNRLKPIGHEDRLSIVEHLTELRTRIIICVIALHARVRPLPLAGGPDPRRRQPAAGRRRQREAVRRDARPARAGGLLAAGAEEGQRADRGHRGRRSPPPRTTIRSSRRRPRRSSKRRSEAVAATPQGSKKLPVTLGVGEPLTATLVAAGYTALLIVAAAAPLPGVRLHPARVLADGAPGRRSR